jgi:hypothetical protein
MHGAAKSLRNTFANRALTVRFDSRRILAGIALVLLCVLSLLVGHTHAQTIGISITPAAISLDLPIGQQQTTADVSITNHYDAPVTLSFAFEPRLDAPKNADILDQLHSTETVVHIAAGQTITQTITLHDSPNLSPGSSLADMVVAEQQTNTQQVGLTSSIRIPITAVKQDGALQTIALAGFSAPQFAWSMPTSLHAGLRNSGNVVSIPRGFIAITAPNGKIVGKGTVNISSQAMAPDMRLDLATPLTKLADARWPGMYTAELHYGLGGDQTQTTRVRFFYVAWWHVFLAIMLGIAAYVGVRYAPRFTRAKPSPPIPRPKKVLLIGRDIS